MKTAIRPIGRFIPKDANGLLERIGAPERIPAHWQAAVDGCVEAYRTHVGEEDLHSVYVRGSVARGEPVDGVSDLDTFAVVHRPRPDKGCWLGLEELWPISVELAARHSVVDKIELGLVPYAGVSDARCRYVRFALAHTAGCVHGEDLGASLPRVKPGPDTVFALPHIDTDVAGLQEWRDDGATWAVLGPWIGKRILRAGLEWSIDVHGEYSRDLWPCLVAFARKCPEGEPDLRRVLALALDPPEDDGQWREAIDAAVRWLRT